MLKNLYLLNYKVFLKRKLNTESPQWGVIILPKEYPALELQLFFQKIGYVLVVLCAKSI
jgi:hypothetical protein